MKGMRARLQSAPSFPPSVGVSRTKSFVTTVLPRKSHLQATALQFRPARQPIVDSAARQVQSLPMFRTAQSPVWLPLTFPELHGAMLSVQLAPGRKAGTSLTGLPQFHARTSQRKKAKLGGRVRRHAPLATYVIGQVARQKAVRGVGTFPGLGGAHPSTPPSRNGPENDTSRS